MKQIIISSLQFLVNEGMVKIYGFVLMPNHIHIIWQIQDGYETAKVQQGFLKYTAQQMKFILADNNKKELEKYKVKASDRAYQILGTQFVNHRFMDPEEYKYSSSRFYEKGVDEFELLTHYPG